MDEGQQREWIERLSCNDAEALAGMLKEYDARLRKLIGFRMDRRLWGRLDVADVLQEVYLAAERQRNDYLANPAVPVYVWLRTVTLHVLADLYRRHLGAQRRDARLDVPLSRRPGDATSAVSMAAVLAASLTSPSGAAARADAREQLYAALDKMDGIDREVLALRHFEDLTNGEAAEVLGLKKAAASNRYIRALKRLKEVLSDAGFEQ